MQTRKVQGRSTVVTFDPAHGVYSVVYHKTIVVLFSDDYVELDAGGWLTPTTRLRMNQASNEYSLGYHVYQDKKQWWINWGGVEPLRWDGEKIRFRREGQRLLFGDDKALTPGEPVTDMVEY